MNVNTAELETTRLLIEADPSLLDMNKVGRCPVGLTLSRILNRQLTIDDKHDVLELARIHLGLDDQQFDALYRISAWPDDLRLRWHTISVRREMMSHPEGHIANDGEEQAARTKVAAEVLRRFIAEEASHETRI